MRNTFEELIAICAALIVLVAVLAGCGGDDSSVDDAIGAAAATAAAQVETDTTSSGADSEAPATAVGADDGQPETLLAYRLTAPAGTVVELDQMIEVEGGIAEQSGTHIFEDGPEGLAYSPFVIGVEIVFTVEEGGPVEIELFTTPWDPDADPFIDFATVEVVDVLTTGQASIDSPTTLSAP